MSDSNIAPKPRTLILSIVLLALSGVWGSVQLFGGGFSPRGTGNGFSDSSAPVQPPFNASSWVWHGEEHWVVDQVARDIGEMLCVASGEKPEAYRFMITQDPRASHAYVLRAEGPKFHTPIERPFVIREWTWDPSDFGPWAHDIASELGVKPAPADPALSASVTVQLLRPDESTVEDAATRVSAALNRCPASADAHDAAGAVFVAFGLFGDQGVFTDRRHALCRLSAHAAVASTLRLGDPGPSAYLSRLGLLAMISRTENCTHEVATLRAMKRPPLDSAWLNVIQMLATGDWRGVVDPTTATPAEVLASFAGRCQYQSVQQALDWTRKSSKFEPPAFLFHEASNWDMSVGLHGQIPRAAYLADLEAIENMRERFHSSAQGGTRMLISELNTHAGRCYNPAAGGLQVLGWGDWAQRFQASLLDDMMRTIDYDANHLGSKEDQDAYLDQIERTYGDLEQFPILQKRYANLRPSVYRGAIQRAEQLLKSHPEVVADGNFPCLDEATPGGAPPRSMPTYRQWEVIPLPFGTAYNAFKRCYEMREWTALPSSDYEHLRVIDPWNWWLRRCVMEKEAKGAPPTPQAVEKAFESMKGFAPDLYLRWMDHAYPGNSPERIPVLEQEVQLDPGAYFKLSWLYVQLQRDPEALQAALKGYELDMKGEPVRVSNNMLWAVRYLYRTSQKAQAESIAKACADVYSATGLQTLAVLRELQGRYGEAEELYGEIRERYQDNQPYLFGLYARNAANDPSMNAKFQSLVAAHFPQGIQTWTMAGETRAPATGVRLDRTPKWVQDEGLLPDAVIVAFDGKKVENADQYMAVRAINLDDRFSLTVYQAGKYQTLQMEAPDRLFGVGLLDYRH